jgi:hypothetical protein
VREVVRGVCVCERERERERERNGLEAVCGYPRLRRGGETRFRSLVKRTNGAGGGH